MAQMALMDIYPQITQMDADNADDDDRELG
jgi:hypothetical protein